MIFNDKAFTVIIFPIVIIIIIAPLEYWYDSIQDRAIFVAILLIVVNSWYIIHRPPKFGVWAKKKTSSIRIKQNNMIFFASFSWPQHYSAIELVNLENTVRFIFSSSSSPSASSVYHFLCVICYDKFCNSP